MLKSLNKGVSAISIVITLVIVTLVVGGIYFYLQSQVPKETKIGGENGSVANNNLTNQIILESEQLIKCNQTGVNDSFEKLECFTNLFQKGYSENLCERLYYDADKEQCYIGASIAKENKNLCQEKGEISDTVCQALIMIAKNEGAPVEQIAKCENSSFNSLCYSYILNKKGYSESLCKDMEDADTCYLAANRVKQDEAVCEKINDYKNKEQCYYYLSIDKKDEALCNKVGDVLRDGCYGSVAMVKQDVALCEKILSVGMNEKEACYGGIAMSKKDETLCENLPEPIKDDCYYAIAKAKNDENICEEAGYQEKSCYMDIAINKLDENLCKKSGSDVCYFQLAKLKLNENLCGKISKDASSFVSKDLCFEGVAIAKNDPTVCEKTTAEYKGGCYHDLAVFEKDETLCEKAGNLGDIEICYSAVAMAKMDETLCEKVGSIKDMCYYSLARAKNNKTLCEMAGRLKDNCNRYFEQ